MPPALVLFDCDGVLVDSEPITTRLIVEHVARLGVPLDAAETLARFKGGTLAQVVAEVESIRGSPVPDDFVAAFRADLVVRLAQEVKPVPGVLEVVRSLDVPMCVASNGPREKMAATLGATGLLPYFEGRIFSAYELDVFKPDPGLFLHAAETLGADPAACVVVEDSGSGIRAGRAAGMTVHAYVRDADAAQRRSYAGLLEGTPGRLFDDMRDLPDLLAT